LLRQFFAGEVMKLHQEESMLNCKRTAVFSAFLAIFLLSATPVMAADNYGTQVVQKFGRGLGNAATGWLEIPKNIVNESRNTNVGLGITWGLVKGVAHTVGRTVVGVLDLAFFFVPTQQYVHPTYAWDPFEKDTTYGVK